MKSKTIFIVFSILLLTSFISKIKGKKSSKFSKSVLKEKDGDKNLVESEVRKSPRKLQDSNYVTITYSNLSEDLTTNSCWYSQIQDIISKVEINEVDVGDFTNSFKITSGATIKIYFSNQLIDLSYFLTYNPDNIPTGCSGYTDFTSKIQSVDLSNLDTSQVTMAASMFLQYTSLTTVNFGNIVTSQIKSMHSMFDGCTSLEEIDLSMLSTGSVTDMSNMFNNCIKLKNVNFGNIDTSCVVTFNLMFFGCRALTSIDLSNLDTSSVTDMSYMFAGCGFKQFTFPRWNTPVLETMERMFVYCEQLEEINFLNLDARSVTTMKYMFGLCNSLTSVDLSVLKISNLENVDSLFSDCTSLKIVDVSNINTASLINMDSMFYNCENLISVDFTNFDTSNVETMEFVFHNCQKLKSLDLSSWDLSKVTSIFNIFLNCSSLISFEIPNFFMEKLISDKAFENTELNQLRYINIKNMKYKSDVEYDETSCENNGCDLPINFNNKPTFVCQTNPFIKNSNIVNMCCSFNIETDMCQSDNNIVLYFNNECSYTNGFKNDYRNDINFINYNGETLTDNSALNIAKDTQLEVHFKTPVTNMEKYF